LDRSSDPISAADSWLNQNQKEEIKSKNKEDAIGKKNQVSGEKEKKRRDSEEENG